MPTGGKGRWRLNSSYGCGTGIGGTGGMIQPVQNQVPCLPSGLLPHLFYSVPREENSPTWAGKAVEGGAGQGWGTDLQG